MRMTKRHQTCYITTRPSLTLHHAMPINIAIDRGGTFCDVIAKIPGQEDYVFKLLSVDPKNYADAPTEGIRRVLERATGRAIAKGAKLKLDAIGSIRMGTTVATNALLERKGANVCLVTTKGFKDVLAIGNQTRPHIFDLTAKKLGHLYLQVIEVDERVTIESFSEGGDSQLAADDDAALERGVTGDVVRVIRRPNYDEVARQLQALYDGGLRALALSLLHLYVYPQHEARIAEIARKIGFAVSVSHQLQPMVGMVNRTSSTVADAYLTPIINDYIEKFGAGFEGGLALFGNKLLFMQSNGGLCPWYKFSGLKAILLGPAGGMVGFGETCYDAALARATIGFDAGGTSTDVLRYAGSLNHIYETVVSEVSLQTPQLDISTVAAGGGLMLFWKNGMFVVGPELAGSNPGPVCYRKGGPLTITDANLVLGRLLPEYFPKIFGPGQDEPLDLATTRRKFDELTAQINATNAVALLVEEVALGFLKVAVEQMCRPIRTLTEAKGFSTAAHNLACFGGSGGQFLVALAKNLGITHVAVHKYSSLLSAYGILLADIVIERQAPVSMVYAEANFGELDARIDALVAQAFQEYRDQNLTTATRLEVYLNMKYGGSDTHLLILRDDAHNAAQQFVERHRAEFGFSMDREVRVDDIQVLLVVESMDKQPQNPYQELAELAASGGVVAADAPSATQQIYFDKAGWRQSGIFQIGELAVGAAVAGPAIIIDDTQTILVEPRSEAVKLRHHIVVRVLVDEAPELLPTVVDPIQLLVFGHRFMSIAEQMGKTLQQTSILTNIKERLDFSCAVFDGNGDLVANAPHVPIHLGAMLFAVKAQMELWRDRLQPGDVLVLNHPKAGGSHLPDITVITPVLDSRNKPIFWTALRGHHADIGLISAGSMPPNSKTIFEEGAAIITHKLCTNGQFDEAGITRLLLEEPAKFPGCSGTRTLNDNLSDLKAQVSANYKGISLLSGLIEDFSYDTVSLYMTGIQETAELAVRNLLKEAHAKFDGQNLTAMDYLDDGTPIALQISIDPVSGSLVFDFSQSGDEIYGNLNAPKAILYSAVLYVLRSLISTDIPLNNGCLKPIEVVTRPGSVLDPSFEAAVVGGNVETTQRIVDVILKAFQAAAASQGTCNNFTFGINDAERQVSFGYYETICGGLGAGPTWHGQSVVQCHTTNTRMTDVEVFEKRYPVILHEYSIRTGSGGDGLFKGGDGVVRDIEFTLENLQVSCLMERRSLAPFGLLGGGLAKRGENHWLRRSKTDPTSYKKIFLGGKCSLQVAKGDRIIIKTPGGGGYGHANQHNSAQKYNYNITGTAPSGLRGSAAMRSMIQETN